MKWEYHIEKVEMPSEWPIGEALAKKWEDLRTNHIEVMNKLGLDGWEYFMNIGPLFYFKRPQLDRVEVEELRAKVKRLTLENEHAYDVGLPGLPPRDVDPQLYEDLGLE